MSKFFLVFARHSKAREFLKLIQGAMIVMEYVAKFIELSRFADYYVVTVMAKVRKIEDDLKLSIRGKIVGFLLKDMDSMVRTSTSIERDIDEQRASGMRVLVGRERRVNLLLARGRSRRLILHNRFSCKVATIRAKARPEQGY